SQKRKHQHLQAAQFSLCGVAAGTFAVSARHEMPWARRTRRLIEELAVWTNRLKTVVLDDDRLPQEEPQNHWEENGPGEVDDVGLVKQAEECHRTWLPHNAERQCCVVHAIGGRGRREHQLYGSTGS